MGVERFSKLKGNTQFAPTRNDVKQELDLYVIERVFSTWKSYHDTSMQLKVVKKNDIGRKSVCRQRTTSST